MTVHSGFTPLMNALLCNLSILCIWQIMEYLQFGQLQNGQTGDTLAGMLYFLLTYHLFRKLDARPKTEHQKHETEDGGNDHH